MLVPTKPGLVPGHSPVVFSLVLSLDPYGSWPKALFLDCSPNGGNENRDLCYNRKPQYSITTTLRKYSYTYMCGIPLQDQPPSLMRR